MKTFIVLGMHRSATSFVACGLHQAAVFMGDKFLPPNRGNEKGYFEDLGFVQLNDLILHRAGGSWDKPPSEKAIIDAGKSLAPDIKKKIEENNCSPFWGWKDPRNTLTVKCFLPYVKNPHFIACFRDPAEVAKSLKRRDGMATKDGLKLARIYNQRLIKFLGEWTG